MQANEEGGLPERVRQRALDMADDADLRKRPPQSFTEIIELASDQTTIIAPGRDPRLPPPGDELHKTYKGQMLVAPDRFTIMNAIKNLQGLWEHLTMGERSRLMTQLVTSIDHDPSDSTLSITLSPIGLKSFATNPIDNSNQSTSNHK